MKVYSRIVLDIASGKTLEADFFDYRGPVALLKSPKAPKESDEEKALKQEQTDILRQQRDIIERQVRQQDLLAPFLYKQLGLTPTFDENGEITGFTQADDPLAAQEKEIQKSFLDRTQAALRGELPQDPALLSELDKQEKELNESLRKQLGPGYMTSTPGQEALANFSKKKAELMSAASRGDLTLAETLGLARGGSNQARVGDFLQRTSGINQLPLSSAGAFGAAAGGYSSLLNRFQNERGMALQARMAGAQNQFGLFSDIMGAGANIGKAWMMS